jgi:hypothetical protein
MPADNRSRRLVDECTLEEVTNRVNKHVETIQPDEMTSELRDRQCGYPAKRQQAPLEMEQKAYLEESRRAIGDDQCTEHRANVKCTFN